MDDKKPKLLECYNAEELLMLNILGGSEFEEDIDRELDRRATLGIGQKVSEEEFSITTFLGSHLAFLS